MKAVELAYRHIHGRENSATKPPLSGILQLNSYTHLLMVAEPTEDPSFTRRHRIRATEYRITATVPLWDGTDATGEPMLGEVTPLEGMGINIKSRSPERALQKGTRVLSRIEGIKNLGR